MADTAKKAYPAFNGGRVELQGNKLTIPVPYIFTADAAVSLETVCGGAGSLLNAAGEQAFGVSISVQTNNIRHAFGGTVPSATIGHLITAGQTWRYTGLDLNTLQLVNAVGGANSTLQITLEF